MIKIQTQMHIITATVNFGTLKLLLYKSYRYLGKKGRTEGTLHDAFIKKH